MTSHLPSSSHPPPKNYELRFPRITKIFRASERGWRDGVTLQNLHKIARDCVGRDRSNKDVDDWNNRLWGKPVSPGVTSSPKRKAVADEWEEKLIASDRKLARKKGWTAFDSRVLATRSTIETDNTVRSRPLVSVTNLGLSRSPVVETTRTPTPRIPSSSRPRLPAAYPSSASSPSAVQREKCRQPTPVGGKSESISDVLSKSLVFVAAQNPVSRRRWKLLVPPERIVHSLEALFSGCGWNSEPQHPPSPWVQRGVIVLDQGDGSSRVLDAVNQRKASCADRSDRKAIWFLESKEGDEQ